MDWTTLPVGSLTQLEALWCYSRWADVPACWGYLAFGQVKPSEATFWN